MKKTMLILGFAVCSLATYAQVSKDAQIKPPDKPVSNPNQLPNYYQNNSSYSNNSMQNNKPANTNNSSFPGNGNYVDPTRQPAGTYSTGSNNRLPDAGSLNNSTHTNAGGSSSNK